MVKPFFALKKEVEMVENARKHNDECSGEAGRNIQAEKSIGRDAVLSRPAGDNNKNREFETFELKADVEYQPVTENEEPAKTKTVDAVQDNYELVKCANCNKTFKIADEPIPKKCPMCSVEW